MSPRWSILCALLGEQVPKLTVLTNDIAREVPFAHKSSVRQILETAGLWVRTGCRGDGACGLCLVQVEAGEIHGPTRNERLLLPPEVLERQIRLACQLMPQDDLSVRIAGTAPPSDWRDLPPDLLPCTPSHVDSSVDGRSPAAAYGLAVDLGTTHISLSLWDLEHGPGSPAAWV